MEKEILTKIGPVRDYCFLSDPNAAETFIVERSGRVRLYFENDSPPLPEMRHDADVPALFFAPAGEWSWKEGFLPVLRISGEGLPLEELFASGKFLYRKNSQGVFRYPGGEKVSEQEAEVRLDEIRCCWREFFREMAEIPGISERTTYAWKSCFVQSLCSFWGLHTKYGVEEYGCMRHDAFPPTVLAMAGALQEFGNIALARRLLKRYFDRFLRPDGSIRYYGAAISEYGGLLRLGCELSGGEGGAEYFALIRDSLLGIYRQMRDLLDCVMNPPATKYALLCGSPEADLRDRKDEYLHNNAQVLRGMKCLNALLEKYAVRPDLWEAEDFTATLERRFRSAVSDVRGRFPFLPYRLKDPAEITDFTADMDWAFANYRYYPELLESGVLAISDARAVIDAHFARNGAVMGMTTLHYPAQYLLCFDHWPLASLGRGLLEADDVAHFHEILLGHFQRYMSQDIFTCYESCLPGTPHMRVYTDWCVPAQLVFPRLLRYCSGFRKADGSEIVPGLPAGV